MHQPSSWRGRQQSPVPSIARPTSQDFNGGRAHTQRDRGCSAARAPLRTPHCIIAMFHALAPTTMHHRLPATRRTIVRLEPRLRWWERTAGAGCIRPLHASRIPCRIHRTRKMYPRSRADRLQSPLVVETVCDRVKGTQRRRGSSVTHHPSASSDPLRRWMGLTGFRPDGIDTNVLDSAA